MHSPNSRHVSEGPWIPPSSTVSEPSTPQQVPKPYVLVMLKGFCTEFFDTFEDMQTFARREQTKLRPFVCYRYWPGTNYYVQIPDPFEAGLHA